MKHAIALTTAVLLASAGLSVQAYALDAGVGVGGSVGASGQVGGGGQADGNSGSSGNSGISGNVGVGGNASAGGNTGAQVQTDDGTTASTNSDANFGALISTIRSGDSGAAAIDGMSEVSSVTVVNVDDLAQGNSTEALDNALSDNEDDQTSLQAAIDANANLTAELVEQSIDSDDVIAAEVQADGSVTVFVQ